MSGCRDQSSFSGIIPVKPGWLVGMDCTAVAYTVCNVDVKPIINGIITEKKSSGKLFIIAYTLEYSPLNNVGRAMSLMLHAYAEKLNVIKYIITIFLWDTDGKKLLVYTYLLIHHKLRARH